MDDEKLKKDAETAFELHKRLYDPERFREFLEENHREAMREKIYRAGVSNGTNPESFFLWQHYTRANSCDL